jgi:hypothetical protein
VLPLLHRLVLAARRRPLHAALALAAIAVGAWCVIAPLAAARYPPMTDLPFHAAHAATFRHYGDPAFHFREQFELRPLAVPYMSMYAIAAALMFVMPPLAAIKIAAAVMLLLVPAGLAVMFYGMKKSPLLGLLGLAVVWCTLAHWGFLNFVGALGLFAMCVGLTLMLVDRPTRGRQIALVIALVALFFTHIFRYPFALCAVAGSAIVMYPATRRIRPVVLPLVIGIALMLLWMKVRPSVLQGDVGPIAIHWERLDEVPGLVVGGFVDPAEKQAFAAFFRTAAAVAFASLAAAALRVLGREGPAPRAQVAWAAGAVIVPLACAAVFLGMFLVLPMQMGVWWYVYPREATAAAFVALGALPDLPRRIWIRIPLVAALAGAAIGIAQVVVKNYAQFDRATADFDAITREIPQAPKLLYLIFDHGGSTRATTPFIHLPAYVQAERGGWLSFHFAVWGSSPLAYRDPKQPGAVVPPPVPIRWEWTPHLFKVDRQGRFFDWFLVRSARSPDPMFQPDPSIERVDHIGTWWLYRRR